MRLVQVLSQLSSLISLSTIFIAAPRASAFSGATSSLNSNHQFSSSSIPTNNQNLLFHQAYNDQYYHRYNRNQGRHSNPVAIQSTSSSVSESSPKSKNFLRRLLYNLSIFFRKVLYPHTIIPRSLASSTVDPATIAAPLPDGTLGCPLFGHFILGGDSKRGPGTFWRNMSNKLQNPGIFKVAFLGNPMVCVSGMSNLKNVLDREFKSPEKGGISTGTISDNADVATEIFGEESLLRATDKGEHSWLRKLVGKSMSPGSVSKSIPQLVQGADLALEEMLQKGSDGVVMEDICTKYTLDVAWRQILGLDLSDEEVPKFHQAVDTWIFGVINPLLFILPNFIGRRLKSYKARQYLDGLIVAKIDDLKRNGPDGSTLSSMVFAKDDDNEDNNNGSKTTHGRKELTLKQIQDNALLLILAGSETSASTLTTAMLFLGMYPEIYKQIQEEQQEVQNKYGHEQQFTREMLDDMPMLEAFIRETMRIKPLNSGAPRTTKEAIIVDGKQIPKKWTVMCNVQLTHMNDPTTIETDGVENNMDIYKGFKPERWLSEETKPSEWVSFGYGPRYCLGASLAMAEMKIFLSLVARNVEFSLVNGKDDIKWQKVSIIPKPKDGTLIYAEKKN